LTFSGCLGGDPGARALNAESIGLPISDFGFFGAFVFQSAFRNLQFAIPMARPFHGIKSTS
jgi:hypothetical protein